MPASIGWEFYNKRLQSKTTFDFALGRRRRWPVYCLGGGEKMFTNQRFDNWELKQSTLSGLESLGWEKATPVQRDTIPTALDGNDVIGQARTGSGKTGAFGIPIIEACQPTGTLQALILAPTRELANQVSVERIISKEILD